MSDHRDDRRVYLERVADRLRLPGDATADVIDELDAHIAESIASLQDEGLGPHQAEREALARLGDPGELGDGIRLAKQTRRRLLVAAGYGLWAAVGGAFWGYLFAAAVVTLSAVLAMISLSSIVQLAGLSTSGWDTSTSILSLPFAGFASAYAGYRVPGAMARRSLRPTRELAPTVALVGGVVLAIVTLFVVRVAVDPMTLAILLSIPLGFVGGALLASDARSVGRIVLRGRWILAVVAIMTGVLLLSGAATLRINPPAPTSDPAFERIGPSASVVLGDGWVNVDTGGFGFDGIILMSLQAEPPASLDGWSDIRLEAWTARPGGRLDPASTGPVLTAPLTRRGDGTFDGRIVLPTAKERGWYTAVTTGTAPDGRRYVLSGPDGPTPSRPWVGTAWEYLTSP